MVVRCRRLVGVYSFWEECVIAQTNTCGTSLAVKKSCSISVTFTPTQTGTRLGALMISDNATGSPQSVSLSGVGK